MLDAYQMYVSLAASNREVSSLPPSEREVIIRDLGTILRDTALVAGELGVSLSTLAERNMATLAVSR
jgi:hypothetical protein